MYQKHAFQSEHTGNCGQMGRGKFSGPWGRGKFGKFWGRHAGGFTQPPVNIEETDEAYVISLFAAGLTKEQVTLTVKNDVLRIAYPGATPGDGPESTASGKYTYQEYSQGAFERSFKLNGKVIVDAISANYADGTLKVVLPKDPTTNKPAQTISVA